MLVNLSLRQADMPRIVLQLLKEHVNSCGIRDDLWTRIEMLEGLDANYFKHIFNPNQSEVLKNSSELAEAFIANRQAKWSYLIDDDEVEAMSGVLFLASFIKQEIPSQDKEYLMLMDGFYPQPLQMELDNDELLILLEPLVLGYVLRYVSVSCSLHSDIPMQIKDLSEELNTDSVRNILELFSKETGVPTSGLALFLDYTFIFRFYP
jgi:hypothetical protein